MTHFKQLCQTMNLNLHVSQSGDAVLNALNLYFSKNPEGNFKMVYFNFFTIKLYESIDHCEYGQNK